MPDLPSFRNISLKMPQMMLPLPNQSVYFFRYSIVLSINFVQTHSPFSLIGAILW